MDLITAFTNINWLSVLAGTVSSFIIGGIWYGPLFGKAWMAAFNFTIEDLKKRSIPKTFGISILLAFIATVNLEMFIGAEADLVFGALAGFFAGVGWVATFLGILYVFEMQSLKAYLINAGYCIISLTIIGAILGIW
ncbi:DUF1761 domain-containing protein [Aquimarina sp. 2201CG5-10]|uniref:DUF1761 domain-containing protein n=1 Tax=Aquimarina callyspongiae TaxID=3098150 RepID=UPI002AB5882A|nr:DUF1761 domain-containing protein [Aquimarina sp. 2201CG5-10]MDY8137183.1 DUF1761 domain-containing protein [Aquimarina sp. 2201CG5-10]